MRIILIQLQEKLVNKSIEAFLLALEIYNKPTIKYRAEGFSFFYLQRMGAYAKSGAIA